MNAGSNSTSKEGIMTTAVIRLTGDSLLKHVAEYKELITRGEKTRTEAVLAAGYAYDNGKAAYVDYYTEVLRAQGDLPVTDQDVEDQVYTNLSGVEQDLYDAIHDKFGRKWDHEEIMEFMQELSDIGIESPEALVDAYEYQTGEYSPEAVFAEYYVNEVHCTGIPEILEGHINWHEVWDCELRYDYNTIDFDGETFFFRNV
jgi:hypothetical protein